MEAAPALCEGVLGEPGCTVPVWNSQIKVGHSGFDKLGLCKAVSGEPVKGRKENTDPPQSATGVAGLMALDNVVNSSDNTLEIANRGYLGKHTCGQ